MHEFDDELPSYSEQKYHSRNINSTDFPKILHVNPSTKLQSNQTTLARRKWGYMRSSMQYLYSGVRISNQNQSIPNFFHSFPVRVPLI